MNIKRHKSIAVILAIITHSSITESDQIHFYWVLLQQGHMFINLNDGTMSWVEYYDVRKEALLDYLLSM